MDKLPSHAERNGKKSDPQPDPRKTGRRNGDLVHGRREPAVLVARVSKFQRQSSILPYKSLILSSTAHSSTSGFMHPFGEDFDRINSIFIRMESEDGVSQLPKLMGGKLYWSTAMDDCMLEVFLNHLAQGRRTPSGWKKSTTYHAIKEALKLNLNMDVSINQIENRVKTMRNQIMAFKTLNSSCSGFGWDSETRILTADERVWDEALKANPNLKTYKKKLLPRFNEWMDVIGDNAANGNIQKTCFTADVDSHVEDPVDLTTQHNVDPLLGSSMTFETINLDEDGGIQHVPDSPTLPQLPKTNKLPQRKRKSLAMGLKEEMGNMRETMETFVDVLKEKNRYDDIIWDQVSAAIYSIEEIDEDTKVEALELFSGEHVENRKRCFLRIPDHKRKGWLLKKLNEVDV